MSHLIRTLLCVALLPLTAWAEEPAWPDLMKSGRESQVAGKYAHAKKVFAQALAESQKFEKSDPRRTETRLELADALLELGEYGPCEKLCVESIADVQEQHGDEHPQIAQAERILTDVYIRLGMAGLAEEHCQQGLEISEALHGKRDAASAVFQARMRHIANLGSEYGDSNIGDEAEGVLEAAFGRFDPRLVVAIEARAADQGDQWVPKFAERALAIADKSYGRQHPIYGRCLSTLATALRHKHEFEAAELRTRQAIDVLTAALGPNSPQLAQAYRNLAWIERQHGHSAQADARFHDSIRLRFSGLSDDDLCHFLDEFMESDQFKSGSHRDDYVAEIYLTEMTRRGGQTFVEFLAGKLEAWRKRYREVSAELDKPEVRDATGQEAAERWSDLEDQRGFYSQNLAVATALCRIQNKPDPLQIVVAGAQELTEEFPDLPALDVTLKNLDADQRDIGFQDSGDYRSGRQARWRIEATNAAGSLRPFKQLYGFIIGGGQSQRSMLKPGEGWETTLNMASFVETLEPGDYQLRVLYHNELTIVDRDFVTELITCRSQPLKLTIKRRAIQVTKQRRDELVALLKHFDDRQPCKVLGGKYGEWAHEFIDPQSDYGRILSWDWSVVPGLMEDLQREGQTPRRRAHLLALLFSITGQNDPGCRGWLLGNAALGEYSTLEPGWGLSFKRTGNEGAGGAGFGFTHGPSEHKTELDAKAQEPFLERWREFPKRLDVKMEE